MKDEHKKQVDSLLFRVGYWGMVMGFITVFTIALYGFIGDHNNRNLYRYQAYSPHLSADQLSLVANYYRSVLLGKEAALSSKLAKTIKRFPFKAELWQNGKVWASLSQFGYGASPNNISVLNQRYLADADDMVLAMSFLHAPERMNGIGSLKRFFKSHDAQAAFLSCNQQYVMLQNTEWLSSNKAKWMAVRDRLKALGCTLLDVQKNKARVTKFKATQYVQHGKDGDVTPWLNGDAYIAPAEVMRDRLEQFLHEQMAYYKRAMNDQGKLEYMYLPSVGVFSDKEQTTRQWLATQSIGEAYNYFNDEAYKSIWLQNSQYNLDAYFNADKGRVEYADKAHLSTNAVAALAITTLSNKRIFEAYYQALINTIKQQIKSDDTMFESVITADADNVKNDKDFAPGIALMALARGVKQGVIEVNKTQLKALFHHYYNYYRNAKTLYGMGWHTMGYEALYRLTNDKEYRDAIFTINDEMLRCQQTNPKKAGVFLGWFGGVGKCPNKSRPPATQVEGLIYAYRLAKEAGFEARAGRYRQAIVMGLRTFLQTQITERNSFLWPNAKMTEGAMRNGMLDNRIRIDNPSHSMMPVIEALKYIDGL